MSSLRDLSRSAGGRFSVREWAERRQMQAPLSLRKILDAYAPPGLRGFADLHAHPASHLAFGADRNGGGLFHGNPSTLPVEPVDMSTAAMEHGLACCDGNIHGFEIDPVKCLQRTGIMAFGVADNAFHNSHGWPDFAGWPNATDLAHQMMHITCIHRAWQGGLRLMIASVTDNQLLSQLWNCGFNLMPSFPSPVPGFDMSSARRQLMFIRAQAAANEAWMQIVTSPAQAREVIGANKLAVILGVEMDGLTAAEIVQLKNELGVCQVVPIHLADNTFGGCAVYDDLFNTNNWYLHGGKCSNPTDDHQCDKFYRVEFDPSLKARLGQPNFLLQITPDILGLLGATLTVVDPLRIAVPIIHLSLALSGLVIPFPVSPDDHHRLSYGLLPDFGHKNKRGLVRDELRKLMQAGFLIDLAHMSEHSQIDALDLAHTVGGYPLMNTHTGIRPGPPKPSERDMPEPLVKKMSQDGGVIGTSTAGYYDDDKNPSGDQLDQWINDYYHVWNVMGRRGCALGTDFNGLSPQMPCSSKEVEYDDPPLNSLGKSSLGTRRFDFATDGLAHYGMLADFVEALRQYDIRGADIADYLLQRTAEDTVAMWERVEQVAATM